MASYLKPDLKNMNFKEKEALVKKAIKEHKVMIFSKTYWPYATAGKTAVKNTGVKHTILELDAQGESRNGQVQKILKKMTGFGTVPNIFVGGKSIGGGSETKALYESGKLVPMMQSAGCEFS